MVARATRPPQPSARNPYRRRAIRSIVNAEELRLNHRFDVVRGVLEHDCRKLLQDFFRYRREDQ